MKVKINKKAAIKKADNKKNTQQSSGDRIISLLYTVLRGTPLFAANLRKSDFTGPQQFETGSIPRNVQAVILEGVQGIAISLCNVKGTLVDLMNGKLLDISTVKKHQVLSRSKAVQWAKKVGKLHTILHGSKKTRRDGYIVGNLSDQYVGFVSKDGKFIDTLETKALPKGRNAERLFSLAK